MKQLFASLNERKRPEDIAQLVMEKLDGQLRSTERVLLQKAARGSLKQQAYAYTSMAQEFAKPVGMDHQVAMAEMLFSCSTVLTPEQCSDPTAVERFIQEISPQIHKTFGQNDFKYGRLNHETRLASGLQISRRRYNKLFRLLARMENKLHKLIQEIRKYEFVKVGRTGLASKLSWEEFSADTNTACFIAYYVARCNLRSEFTASSQQRPYDEIADMLFKRCKNSQSTHWWAIAQIYASQEVFKHLSDEQKGELISRWFAILQDIAALLKETWRKSDINLETMTVHTGNDSSTWNNTARAWNKAREYWIELLYAMEMEEMLEIMCLGKVLRLMAADVVRWHYYVGGGIHPDTLVWRELPLPWEVLLDAKTCTRTMVEKICLKHGIDPEKTGWTAPRPRNIVAKFKATPELVHGVTVANPFLAKVLRDHGFFSGKKLKISPSDN